MKSAVPINESEELVSLIGETPTKSDAGEKLHDAFPFTRPGWLNYLRENLTFSEFSGSFGDMGTVRILFQSQAPTHSFQVFAYYRSPCREKSHGFFQHASFCGCCKYCCRLDV